MSSLEKHLLESGNEIAETYSEPSQRFNPLRAKPIKWSNTFKQFVGCCRRIV